MQNGESGSGASWSDKLKSFGKDLGNRATEGATVTKLNQATGAVVDVGKQIGHGVSEEVTRFSGAVDVVGDRFGQAGEYIVKTAGNAADSFNKDLSDVVIIAEAKKFGAGILGKIQGGVQDVIMRNAGKLGTIYNDSIAPGLRRAGVDAKNAGPYNAFDNRSESIDPADKSEIRASQQIEGNQLIKDVMGNLKAAVDFDQMKDEAISALLEKAMGNTETARKAGPVLLKGLIAMMMEGSNFSGKTAEASQGLKALLKDKDQLEELSQKQISWAEMAADFDKALDEISSTRELVMDARGRDKHLSWEYEGDLVKASENAQGEVIDLGWEVLDVLPASAADLNVDTLITARAKTIDFSRRANDVINPLISVAKSMEKRFPEKTDEIRASLSKVLAKWTEAKGVARGLMTEVKVDKDTASQVESDVLGGIIGKNDMFNSITPEQQRAVMDKIGARAKGEGEPAQYDRVAGGLYDKAIGAGEEYARLVICYENSREYVQDHPEAVDILMILAENVMQAKSRMELAQNQIDSEVLVQSRKTKNAAEFTAQRQGNLGSEAADRVKNKERYAMILDRYNERVQREAPTVKKIAVLLGVAGFSIVIAKEAGPGAIDAMIETAKFIAKVVADNAPMVARAVGTGAALSAPVLLWNWAREKMGKQAGKDATKELGKAEGEKKQAMDQLQASYDQLIALNQNDAAAKIKEIMDSLKTGNS